MTKNQYFQEQMTKSKSENLRNYYQRRVVELNKQGIGQEQVKISRLDMTSCLDMTSDEMKERAIAIWNTKGHSAATKHLFLVSKGIPEQIILESISFIGDGKMIADI